MASPNSFLHRDGNPEAWWQRAFRELFRLETLPAEGAGWQAKVPTVEATEAAKRMLGVLKEFSELRGLSTPFVAPTLAHGVQFEWQRGGRELEVEISPSGREIEFLTVEGACTARAGYRRKTYRTFETYCAG